MTTPADQSAPPAQPTAQVEPDAVAQLRREVEQLREAMVSRAVIDQAKGVLVRHYRVAPEAAFDLMVRWSQRSNTKLRVVADALVRLAQHPGDGSAAGGVDAELARWLRGRLDAPPTA